MVGNKIHNIFMLQSETKSYLLQLRKDFGLSYHELLLVVQGAENEIRNMAMTNTFYEEFQHLQAMEQKNEIPSVNTSDIE